jgi:hypothetical protein
LPRRSPDHAGSPTRSTANASTAAPQEVGRGEQGSAGLLAVLLEPRRHVHGVAEIGDLAAGIAAFADHRMPGRELGGAEARVDPQQRAADLVRLLELAAGREARGQAIHIGIQNARRGDPP